MPELWEGGLEDPQGWPRGPQCCGSGKPLLWPLGRGQGMLAALRSWLGLLDAVWLQASHLALRILCFLILKMGIISLASCCEDCDVLYKYKYIYNTRLHMHVFVSCFKTLTSYTPLHINSGWHRAVTNLSGLAVSTQHTSVTMNKCMGVIESIR